MTRICNVVLALSTMRENVWSILALLVVNCSLLVVGLVMNELGSARLNGRIDPFRPRHPRFLLAKPSAPRDTSRRETCAGLGKSMLLFEIVHNTLVFVFQYSTRKWSLTGGEDFLIGRNLRQGFSSTVKNIPCYGLTTAVLFT